MRNVAPPSLSAASNEISSSGSVGAHSPVESARVARPQGIADAKYGLAKRPLGAQERTVRWWQAAVARPTRQVLVGHSQARGESSELWQPRLAAFELHTAQLSLWEATLWAAQQICDLVNLPKRALSRMLFPGQWMHLPSFPGGMEPLPGLQRVPQMLITPDHAILDGLSIQHRGVSAKGGPIVVAPGNAMVWEALEPWLMALAEVTSRDVVMYNYRNFGQSTGSICSTNAASRDVQAAIRHTASIAQGASLCVLAISIGGGCAATAIESLQQAGALEPRDIDRFIALHTFSSLPAIMGRLIGSMSTSTARLALACTRMQPLDTAYILNRAALAQHLIVATASSDHIVSPEAALRIPRPLPETWAEAVQTAQEYVHVSLPCVFYLFKPEACIGSLIVQSKQERTCESCTSWYARAS
ncbi:MAG: hypothetical protein EOO38_13330 [Cytophagaceae bacterium]|nr:MAG: hypothetical protein EOO38_13330 [Cytophagaceae bacterium]